LVLEEETKQMPEHAPDMIVRNLVEALNRLHDDLDRVELWTAALSTFQTPAPEYGPNGKYVLPVRPPIQRVAYPDAD
jgi:hypothetical protein